MHDNEVVKAVDFDFGFKSFVNNFALGMSLVMQQDTNFIIGGMVKKSASGGMNLAIEPVYSYCKTAAADIFQGAGNDELTDLVTAVSSDDKDRIDIVEICGQLEAYDVQQRSVNDPETGIKTYPMLNVKQRIKLAAHVKAGTPGSASAPAATAGWVKIAEVKIPANSVEIKAENIFPVTADVGGAENTGWTNEKTSTVSIGHISEINGRFRAEHSKDGSHGVKVIHAANMDFGTGSKQVNASQIPKGGVLKNAGGSTLYPADSVSDVAAKIADEINRRNFQTAGSTQSGSGKYFTLKNPNTEDVIVILARAGEEIAIGIGASDGFYKWGSSAARGSDTDSKIKKLYYDNLDNLVIYGEAGSDFRVKSMSGIKYTVSESEVAPADLTEIPILTLKRDKEPVNGSQNLVTSGGVYTAQRKNTDEISRLGSKVDSLSAQFESNYNYVNGVLGRFSLSSRKINVATTANITLSGLQTVDGVSLAAGLLVLVKDQTDARENGIYEVNSNAWQRYPEFLTFDSIKHKMYVISGGVANKNKIFYSPQENFDGDIGESSLIFSEYKKIKAQQIDDSIITNDKIESGSISLDKVRKQEFFDLLYPVGATYTQYPQQASPNELWGSLSTWQVVDYSGAFFRAEGGNANSFIEKTSALSMQGGQISSHSHSISHTHTRGSMEITGTFAVGMTQGGQSGAFELIDNDAFYIGSSVNIAHKYRFTASRSWTGETSGPSSGQSGSAGGNENRPANFTVRIWRRVA